MENRFPYSFNEKRYHTFNYYLKTHYGGKVAKVMLDGGFTCPNRDGTKAYGGCIFCSQAGSGDANIVSSQDIMRQYEINKQIMDRKWPNEKYIPYFQAYTNTYGPLSRIRAMIEPFLQMDEVAEIAIATRCDCLEKETIAYLQEANRQKPIWLELGLQSSNDHTGELINRQHTFADFKQALYALENSGLKVCVHVMDGLPFESRADMLQTITDIAHLPFDGIKIHMLHVIRNTALAGTYEKQPFTLLKREEYIELVVKQLALLRPQVVVQRLTGDPLKADLLAPEWVLNKTTILNDIDKLMRRLDICQGDNYE